METFRFALVSLLVSLASLVAGVDGATAQPPTFPSPGNRLLTIVVPAVAGGTTDVLGRIMSKSLTASLGLNVIVDNRSGANGNLGSAFVARAKPDGHTLLLAPTNNIVINQFMMQNMGYDPLVDLTPVALVAQAPLVVAIPSTFPPKTMKEFVDTVRAKPGAYSYGSPGFGSPPHLAVERLLRASGMTMTHVPYRGVAAVMSDIANGSIQMTMAALASVEPTSQSGVARLLAVAGAQRYKSLPDIPTFAESGLPDLEISTWWAVMAPKGTSAEIVALLNAKLRQTFEEAETVQMLGKIGVLTRSETPEAFQAFIQTEVKSWEAVVKALPPAKQE